jgi:hypothetical protein
MAPNDVEHSDVTLHLAKEDTKHHMEGMDIASAEMSKRKLLVRAYAVGDPKAPAPGDNVKTVHFVRHGQGFHNLMADMAANDGRTWENVSQTSQYCMYQVALTSNLTLFFSLSAKILLRIHTVHLKF